MRLFKKKLPYNSATTVVFHTNKTDWAPRTLTLQEALNYYRCSRVIVRWESFSSSIGFTSLEDFLITFLHGAVFRMISYHKNRSPMSQQVWHDEHPSMLKGHKRRAKALLLQHFTNNGGIFTCKEVGSCYQTY